MRKFSFILLSLIIFASYGMAQKLDISGKIKDANGKGIANASILEKGSQNGTIANDDGYFKISVKNGAKLIVTALGYATTEISASNASSIVLKSAGNRDLNEVVVTTALGIRRNKNTLPYAAQQVSGDDISRTRGGNAASALSGKVSGLQVIQGNGIGGSTNVVIRGTKSLTNNNQALFVVDGVPIDNSNTNSSNQRTGRGGYDYGNAAADINPDDIESVNVLKGAAASALYGSRASNGVIMITTKKSKKGGLGIVVNSGIVKSSIDKTTFPTYQTQYGAGYSDPYQKDGFFYFDVNGDGIKDYVTPTTEDASYGVKFDPNLMVYQWDAFDKAGPNYHVARPWVAAANNPSSFYISPVSNNNNIMLDGITDKGSFKMGYTRNDEKGVLPNSSVLKNIINFGASYNINSKLTASASANYSKIDGKGRFGTGYNGRNVNQNFRQWYETNVDMQMQKDAYWRNQKNITWNWANPADEVNGLTPIYTDNYYWIVNQNFETDTRSRVFGNASLNYKVNNWINVLGRVSIDTYSELQEERIAVGSNLVASYARYDHNFAESNYDLIATADKNIFKNINLKALIGSNIRKVSNRDIAAATNGGLIVPGIYSLANSKSAITAPSESYTPKEVDGVFAGLTLGYKDYLTLDGTARRDKSSTLPEGANAYNYYSLSGSWLFSKNLNLKWLSSGKVRLNYASVGNDATWGSIKDVYDQPALYGSTILFSQPSVKNNNALKPESTTSKEIGLEMAFLHNRVGFDVTSYVTNTVDQIIPVSISTATGYSSKYLNAGNIQNNGLELSLFVTPIQTKAFSWTVNFNYTKNRNKVVSLYDVSKNLQLASFQGGVSVNATIDQPYGTIQGKTWNLDPVNGGKLVLANGRYSITSTTTNVIGNINPDWLGGITNTFKYKNWALNFLIDIRQGGNVFSLDRYYGMATGVTVETAQLNDLGNPSRNTIANGGGVIMPGNTIDGKPNTTRVENIFGTYGYSYNPAAAFVYDASYVKLRELALSFNVPTKFLGHFKVIKGAEFSLIGRNLWIIHKNLPYSDPEENLSSGNIQGYQSGAYPTTRTIGANLKLKF